MKSSFFLEWSFWHMIEESALEASLKSGKPISKVHLNLPETVSRRQNEQIFQAVIKSAKHHHTICPMRIEDRTVDFPYFAHRPVAVFNFPADI